MAIVSGSVLALAGCASTPPDSTTATAVERACSVEDCFYERDVRNFEVIDKTTVIVYIGSQRCPFRVELTGTFCDLTFAPELYFRSRSDAIQRDSRSATGDVLGNSRGDRSLRVCANDLAIDVDGGSFTETRSADRPGDPFATNEVGDPFGTNRRSASQRYDRFGQTRSQCQVNDVTSLTDDQLLELYVGRGLVPPPPPMGTGEIEVGEQEEPAATLPAPVEPPPAPQAQNVAAGAATPTASD
jgi:hypothetical protein